jgi:hypothetical protein
MQALAVAGDWEGVIRLQAEHRELSERFFMEPVDAGLAPACAAAIREMLLNNQHIAELGQLERTVCVSRKRDINKGRQAVRAYKDHSG